MYSSLRKCVILFLTAVPLFAQNYEAQREQGLITIEPFWRQALGGAVLSLPSVQAQSAVVALDGGNIRAYSTAGTPMWNYSSRGRISEFVTRSREGTSYFSRTNGTLIAVNRSGRELWRRNIGGPLSAKVIAGWDGRLFVPAEKNILCYTASGTLLWRKTLDSSFTISPKLDRGGRIIFALENNEVYSVDPYGNTHLWILSKTPAALLSSEQRQIIVLYTDGTMETLEMSEDWFITAQSEVHSITLPRLPSSPIAAAIRGNNLAALLDDGRTVLVSTDERKILWTGDSHIRELLKNNGRAEMEAEMLFDERGIFILSRNGATGFSHEGRRLWYMFLHNAAAIPAFGEDGVLYSGGRDWILYAYKIEERTLRTENSLYGPAPEGSYRTGNQQSSLMSENPLLEYEIKSRLEQIDFAVNTGRVGANEPAWMTFLFMISASQEQHIQYRIGALHLLGQLGSRETIPWLANIFRRETEPMVRAAAAAAIGTIGVDPDGIAIQTFLYSMLQSNIRDEQVLTAIASATGALCRFSGPPLSETGIRILNLLSDNSLPSAVRRRANAELASLR
ncbi:MAG: PQQ-like beta-propeller repeat protein [Treponema sp.]|jgi:outer membrane protein assembly factor BamB|nr:PQQ-like beta-propeller repeat protein [Treponema sp.]